MQTSVELLQGILQVVGKIEQQQGKTKESNVKESGVKEIVNISSALAKFAWTKPKTVQRFLDFSRDILDIVKKSNKGKDFKIFADGMVSLSTSISNLVSGLSDLSKIKPRRVDSALNTLQKLYDLMYELGDGRHARKVTKALNLFDRMGRSMKKIGKPLMILGQFLGMLGISLLIFAGGLVLSSKLLGAQNDPEAVLVVLLGTVAVLSLVMIGLGLLGPTLKPGMKTVKGIAKAFFYIGVGLIAFSLSLVMMASYMGQEKGGSGIGKAMLVMAGVILVMVGMFALLGLAGKTVEKGVKTVSGMGLGLFILIGGVFLFTLGLVAIAGLLGMSADTKGIALAFGAMSLTIGAIVGIFWLLGKAKKEVAVGTLVAVLVAGGLMAIGFAIGFLFKQAAAIGGMMSGGKDGENKTSKIFGIEVPPAIAGLGMIGMVFLGAVGAFALLGIPVVAGLVALGAGVAMMVSGVLILFAISVKKLMETSSNIPADFPQKLGFMIGGVFEGMMIGFKTLSEGKDGLIGIKNIIKNSAKIFVVTGILMTASISLSMFARALTAFANLSEMRPIIGTNPDGSPIFGEKINIKNVGQNISTTISDFLKALIESTDGLTKDQAKGIARMGRALTGRRGILTAVIQFTEVLKAYAQFGQEGKIGYSVPMTNADGTVMLDGNGNPIMRQESVLITDVTRNIIDSFTSFVEGITSKSEVFQIDKREGKKMANLAGVLMGKKGKKGKEKYGLLQPIAAFAETLSIYGKFGDNLEMPLLEPDADGNMVLKGSISIQDIAKNIVKSLVTFVTEIAGSDMTANTNKAYNNMQRFEAVMSVTGAIAKNLDSMTKMTDSTIKLADSIKMLSTNLTELPLDKLEGIAAASSAYITKTEGFGNSVNTISTPQQTSGSDGTVTVGDVQQAKQESTKKQSRKEAKAQQIDWGAISANIGEIVGSQVVEAMKAGQVKFVFSGGPEGIMEWG